MAFWECRRRRRSRSRSRSRRRSFICGSFNQKALRGVGQRRALFPTAGPAADTIVSAAAAYRTAAIVV